MKAISTDLFNRKGNFKLFWWMLIGIFRGKNNSRNFEKNYKISRKTQSLRLHKISHKKPVQRSQLLLWRRKFMYTCCVNLPPFTTKFDIIEKWCVQWSTLYLLTRTVRFFFLFTRGLSSSSSDSPESSSSSDDEFEPGSLVSTSDSAFFSSASSSIRPPPSSSSSSPDSSLQRSARYGQILISLFKNLVTFSRLLNTQIVMRSSILRLVKSALSFSPRP